jgi:propionate kinase
MTPLEGLVMGTRCGDVDFGAMAWIAQQTGQSFEDLERVVNKESLLGISGFSSDLRTLKAWHGINARSWHPYLCSPHCAAYRRHAASLHRLDGVVFTGGIGENSTLIRAWWLST